MAITNYHRSIFDFLETYRSEHPEANLTYSLRQKNKVGRPRNLYLFTGDDNKYISIGLYAPVSNNNKTRSISLYFNYDPVTDTIKNSTLAIVYSDEQLLTHRPVYEQIIRQIGPEQFNEYTHNRFELWYKDPDWRKNVQTYLEHHKPIIDRVIQEAGAAETFYIPREKLEAAIVVANQPTAVETSPAVNYWVFQGKPEQFQDGQALEDGTLQKWRVMAHAKRIKLGDKLILWVTGPKAGCYALAEVASEVQTGGDYEDEQDDQLLEGDQESTLWVKFNLLLNLWNRPVTKADLQKLPAFIDFNGGNQGTNFTATKEQYELIEKVATADSRAGREFWKYSPGVQAARWDVDLQDQLMAVNFSNIDTGSLDQYDSLADLKNHLGLSGNPNQPRNLIDFRDAAIGDVIIANEGLQKVVGVGIITGSYQYREGLPYPHYRAVNWLADKPWQYTPYQIARYPNLFRPDTFSRSLIGSEIIQEYVSQYPQYRPVFEKHGLLKSTPFEAHPMPEPSAYYPKNIILYGPPGTGKTYETIDLAVDIVDGRKEPYHRENKHRFDQLRKEGQIEFITFHQSYTYEDFVMGLKPDVDGEDLKFQRSYGIFYRVAKRARDNYEASRADASTATVRPFQEVFDDFMKPLVEDGTEINVKMASGIRFVLYDLSERSVSFRKPNGSIIHTLSIATLRSIYEGLQEIRPNGLRPYYRPLSDELAKLGQQTSKPITPKNYVLIIDEINRANMSRVFGELITLLEDDKRLGGDNELTVTLPSGEPFAVPPNLYLVGTMNTADKSLALLDIALRRRFDFIVKNPDYSVLNSPAKELLERLNRAIIKHKKSADFQIGHAYFINKPVTQLKSVLDNRVIPLLLEYFNGRIEMVETVLNEARIPFTKDELTLQLQADATAF